MTSTGQPQERTRQQTSTVVVAVDGSAHSDATVRWAVGEAMRSGASVRFYSVADDHALRHLGRGASRSACTRAMEEAVEAARSVLGEDRADGEVLTGRVDEAVLERLDGAGLLAVGKRGLHSLPRLLVGSTSLSLAGTSPVPTVVVPEGWNAEDHAAEPVVVGVDPAQENTRLLDLAFDRAEWLDVPLVAVHGHEHPDEEPIPEKDTRLEAMLTGLAESHPGVEVRAVDEDQHPAMAVLDAAGPAQLLVLGRHKDSRFAGFGFGSVTRAVLHYAECPVLVVPTD